jgi:hypothetical protein
MPIEHVATPRNKKPPAAAVKQRREPISLRKFLSFTRGIPDRKMAQWVRVSRVVKLRGPDMRLALRCETVTEKPNTPPERGHYCTFMPVDPKYNGAISQCKALLIDCNCHRWLFVWEFAMWYRGAARLLRTNGDYPESTNPMLRAGGCKHTIVGGEEILRRKL